MAESSSQRSLPAPGDVVHLDLRPAEQPSSAQDDTTPSTRPIKLLTWNIERGYKLEAVIASLVDINADVVSLQEVDIGCERSGGVDTGAAIASALGMNYLFVCEFEELYSPLRDARSQGGGVHGNAILSRWDFASWRVIKHSHHPVDWEAPLHPLAQKEPRRGRRLTLAADVVTPQGTLTVYCCHLEVFCGILGRVWQFSDILADARSCAPMPAAPAAQAAQTAAAQPPTAATAAKTYRHPNPDCHADPEPETEPAAARAPGGEAADWSHSQAACRQAILGDLNTMANGIARLSPHYCCDAMRWRSWRWSEAEWWDRYVLSCTNAGTTDDATASSSGTEATAAINRTLLCLGLPEPVCRNAVNPGFSDPFDVKADITLDNPAYRFWGWHLMTGKLDWALLRGMRVVGKALGNHDFHASDHKWLLLEVMMDGFT